MSEDCLYCRFEKTEENCRGCWEGSNYRPKMTNADKIRAMTDEELASWLNGSVAPCPMPTLVAQNCPLDDDYDCDMCWLEWLKQEADNGG